MRSLKTLSSLVVIFVLASCSPVPDSDKLAESTSVVSDENDDHDDPEPNPEPESGTEVVAESKLTEQPISEPPAEEPDPAATVETPSEKPITPQAWARLHRIALHPDSPEWKEAIQALQSAGDGFTVEHLKRIKTDNMSVEDRDLLRSSLAAINERVSDEDEQKAADLVLPRLERAAYCDLTCNPLETVLVQWTLSKLRSQAHLAKVRARLEEIGANYRPDVEIDHSDVEPDAVYGAMSERVPVYVSRVLGQPIR
ncbi:MAG TPA: hypothetical protein VGM05_08205 [Planctomycetaceae bacterium]|jgi:hypothetical protein